MKFFIDGKNITDDITVGSCVHEDSVSGRSDALSVSFNDDTDAETNWKDWNLEPGMELLVQTDSFSSGTMYVSSIAATDGRLDVRAQSVCNSARGESTQSYEDVSFVELLQEGARALGLTLETYGIKDRTYGNVIRMKQSWLGFLNQRCMLEGAGIKIFDKKLIVFDEKTFEYQDPVKTLELEDLDEYAFSVSDDVLCGIHNRFRYEAQLFDTTVTSDIVYGYHSEMELPCSSLGESERFSKNVMRMHNKQERRASAKVEGCELSAGVTVQLKAADFYAFSGTYFVDRVVTDLLRETQQLYMRKPITGDY